MSGILGGIFDDPAAMRRQQTASDVKTAIFGHLGTAEFVDTLSENESDTLFAAMFGIPRDKLAAVVAPIVDAAETIRRDDRERERTAAIQNKVIERIGPELIAEIERMKGTQPKTKKTYGKDQRHFAAFCADFGVPAMPASPEVIAAYVLDGGMNYSLLRRRLAAVAEQHRLAGHVMPSKDPLVRVALKHVEAKGKTNGKA